MKLLEEAQPFMKYHTMPKIFHWNEIAAMNLERPKDDQLEQLESGLLKHHCCYPDCPEFLQNLATETDRTTGTRHGLHRHIRHNQTVLNNYVPSAHLVARRLFARVGGEAISLETFQRELSQHMELDSRLRRWFQGFEGREAKLRMLYDELRAVYEKT